MGLVTLFATMGLVVNDLIAALSLLGSFLVLVGSFGSEWRLGRFYTWSIGGLIVGTLFQVCIAVSGIPAELIGFILRLPATTINGLLVLSFILLLVHAWIQRNKYRFQ